MKQEIIVLLFGGLLLFSGCCSYFSTPKVGSDTFNFQPEFIKERDYSQQGTVYEPYVVDFILKFDASETPQNRQIYCQVRVDDVLVDDSVYGNLLVYQSGEHKELPLSIWSNVDFADTMPVEVCCSFETQSGSPREMLVEPYCSTKMMIKTTVDVE